MGNIDNRVDTEIKQVIHRWRWPAIISVGVIGLFIAVGLALAKWIPIPAVVTILATFSGCVGIFIVTQIFGKK